MRCKMVKTILTSLNICSNQVTVALTKVPMSVLLGKFKQKWGSEINFDASHESFTSFKLLKRHDFEELPKSLVSCAYMRHTYFHCISDFSEFKFFEVLDI